MKQFKILKLKQEQLEFNLNNVNGNYECGDKQRHILDFVSLQDVKILKVRDDKAKPFPITIEIGDRRTKTIKVSSIYFEKGELKLWMSNDVIMDANDFKHYKEPVEPIKPIMPNAPQPVVNMNNIKQIEEKILNDYKDKTIRLEKTLKKRKETLEQFLIKFFKEWNLEKNTIYTKDKTVQTVKAKRRSLSDIFMICKYYYPNITLKEVLVVLYKTLPVKLNDGFRSSYCNQLKKRVWYYDTVKGAQTFNQEKLDEYGYNYDFYLNNI